MWIFCFHLNSKSYPVIVPDVFPLGFWSGSVAIRYASYHSQNGSVPNRLHYEDHAKKNLFQWKPKTYPIWKLERNDNGPVWWKHSMKTVVFSDIMSFSNKFHFVFNDFRAVSKISLLAASTKPRRIHIVPFRQTNISFTI